MISKRAIAGRHGLGFILTCVFALPLSHKLFADAGPSLAEAARENRARLHFDGKSFAGPALDILLADARNSLFFLIGEEHGIAENPKLVAQLFRSLVADGYTNLVIEVSPPVARLLDVATQAGGIDGLRALYSTPGGEPAFFGMQQEAELLAAARAALPDADQVLWGVDYEVASDRPLLRELARMDRPDTAGQPLDDLTSASAAAWKKHEESGDPRYIFSFSGDPDLVATLRESWPAAGPMAVQIMHTLQETLEINRLWARGSGFLSNERRAALIRSNFLDYWRGWERDAAKPRVMVKLGANHVIRGLNMTGTFDLGSLLPELAALEGERSLSVLVLPGKETLTAVLNPASWTYEPRPPRDNYARGLEALSDAAYPDVYTLIDLEALRPIVRGRDRKFGRDLVRTVHGFDYVLIMSGSTPSSELTHD